MKVATISYVPPKGRLNSDSFMRNLEAFDTKNQLYLYSDDSAWGLNSIANPDIVKHPKKHFAVNNLVFLFGLNLAIDLGLDYMLYLESDVRVRGDNWDQIIFDDCFRARKTPLIYGTPVVFNISQSGFSPLRKAVGLVNEFMNVTNCPAVVHGAWPGSPAHFLLFPNGALGVYHVPTMAKIFDGFRTNIGKSAMEIAAWDHSVGVGMYNLFGSDCIDQFQYATACYSGYGEDMTNHDFRRQLLLNGKCVGVHQCKHDDPWL